MSFWDGERLPERPPVKSQGAIRSEWAAVLLAFLWGIAAVALIAALWSLA
ncbi:MAG TPA: hypothetical protein VN773_09950 [Verrucomicrobiae bacterium]|nr:hypothetical protein [Verrucomicrobiae bacterium]